MAIARWEIRRMAADLLGDLLTLEATEDAPDQAAGVFKDERNLAIDAIRMLNWQAVVVRATDTDNLWFRTRVDHGEKENRLLYVEPAFPVYIKGGDQIDVFMHRGTGWRPEEYDRAINNVIRKANRMQRPEVTALITDTFDRLSPDIPVPDEMDAVFAIDFQQTDGLWETTGTFSVDRVNQTVTPDWETSYVINARTIRLRGLGSYLTLNEDEDESPLPPGYLQYATASDLLLSGSHRQVERETENKALYYADQATQYLSQMLTGSYPNLVWMR